MAGLSGEEKKSIYDNVVSLSKKHTVVIVDHGDTFYKAADKIIALGEKGGNAGGKLIDVDSFLKKQSSIKKITPVAVGNQTKIKLKSCIYKYKGVDISIADNCMNLIIGYSGVGKSTLLKTLVGQLSALNGSFSFSEQVKLRYFEQDLHWENEEKTPIQIVSDCYPSLTIKEVRKNLACCGIMGEHAMQAIGTLSGGEQAKVKICLLILTPCNFIIMDEPTNHLDIQAKQSLKIALKEFKGTVLLVSHEPDFYKEWVQKIISIENIIKKR